MENFLKISKQNKFSFYISNGINYGLSSINKGRKNFPKPTNLKYVNDYARVIDDATKEYIVSVGNELEQKQERK